MSRVIVERNEDGEVKFPDMCVKVPRTMSAVGIFGSIVSPVYDRDEITETHIIGADGTQRPLLIKYPDTSKYPEIIDINVLYSVEMAESLRWEMVEYIKKEIIPKYDAAHEALLQAKGGYFKTEEEDNYPYCVFSIAQSGSGSFVTTNWRKDRPRKKKNEDLCRAYLEVCDLQDQYSSRLFNHNQIFIAVVKNSLPEKYQQYKKMKPHIVNIYVNDRIYIFLWQHQLVGYYFPGPWSDQGPKPIENFKPTGNMLIPQ